MAQEPPFGFKKDLAIQIRNMVRGGGDNILTSQSGAQEERRVAIALTGVSGIPARSGTTPGTALITLCKIDSTSGIVTTSVIETGYNISGLAVDGQRYIAVNREYISGKWVVVMESCEPTP